MRGDDTRRFCDQCQKHVHNISAVTPAERTRLAETDNSPCIFYFQRKDGGVADLSMLAKIRRWLPLMRFVGWTTVIALLSVFLPGCTMMGVSCKDNHIETLTNQDTNSPSTGASGNEAKVMQSPPSF